MGEGIDTAWTLGTLEVARHWEGKVLDRYTDSAVIASYHREQRSGAYTKYAWNIFL